MYIIYDRILRHLRTIASACSGINKAEERLRSVDASMCTIYDCIFSEAQDIQDARSVIKEAEHQIRFLVRLLRSRHPAATRTQQASTCVAASEEVIQRAAQGLEEAGYELLCQVAVTSPAGITAPALLADAPDQIEDMRAIERTPSGGYRCTLRRGKSKRRLIPDVFPTAREARAARDALERLLEMAIPRKRRRPA